MNKKEKIAIIALLAIIIILIGSICLFMNGDTDNKNNQTTQINNTTNATTEVINATLADDSEDTSTQSSSSEESEPEFGTDEYVDKWDESEKTGTDWAYLHDQPVKSENGHEYKRMYDPDTQEGYWYQMDQEYDEDEYFNNK